MRTRTMALIEVGGLPTEGPACFDSEGVDCHIARSSMHRAPQPSLVQVSCLALHPKSPKHSSFLHLGYDFCQEWRTLNPKRYPGFR